MGVLIEAWKVRLDPFFLIADGLTIYTQITKAVNIKLAPSAPGSVLPYKLEITDKHVLNEDEKRTQE